MMEKTNKIEKININCATKIEQLEQMYDLVCVINCKFKDNTANRRKGLQYVIRIMRQRRIRHS